MIEAIATVLVVVGLVALVVRRIARALGANATSSPELTHPATSDLPGAYGALPGIDAPIGALGGVAPNADLSDADVDSAELFGE